MRIRRRLFLPGVLSAAAACHSGPIATHTTLTDDFTPLRTAFNADSGKVRAILLASPTCSVCLRGVHEVDQHWLARDSTPGVVVFVVWSSQLGAHEQNVNAGTTLIADRRVRNYWDPGLAVGTAFSHAAGRTEPAWDVYMLFGPEATWPSAGVPKPDWWEHQLGGLPPDLRLDGARFAAKAAALEQTLR
ncbi:MAG: hypothetical protein ACREL5_07975 [Gemmatimonadales bacterium]